MSDILRRLTCLFLLLALAGTVSGAGSVAAGKPGIAKVTILQAADPFGRDGSPGIVAEAGIVHKSEDCYFPLWNLPAYYVCVMVCKIGGGGDSCPDTCERALSVCS